jgi:hypothetical protein
MAGRVKVLSPLLKSFARGLAHSKHIRTQFTKELSSNMKGVTVVGGRGEGGGVKVVK